MKTALTLTAALAVILACDAATAYAKGPHGSHGSFRQARRIVRTNNQPVYKAPIIVGKPIINPVPIVNPLPIVTPVTGIIPVHTIHPKHHPHHRRYRHDIDIPDVDFDELDVVDEDDGDDAAVVDAECDSMPAPVATAGTSANSPAADDDDDDDDDDAISTVAPAPVVAPGAPTKTPKGP